jgi:PRTRC genetic system protein A
MHSGDNAMYHVLDKPFTNTIEALYIVAGDGIYKVLDCFGMRIPMPLVSCEIRGLLPLAPQLSSDVLAEVSEEACLFDFGPSYHILTEDNLPPIDPRRVYQYVVAREGVFLLTRGTGLEVLMPISLPCALPGLASASPGIRFSYPLVDENMVLTILERSKAAQDHTGTPIECLFYLTWEGMWRLHEPEQDAGPGYVRAKQATLEYEVATLEGHSHHNMPAYFSHRDDQAEIRDGGFRVYFVLGRIFSQPELRVRICVHGYAWEVPASYFFAVPAEITDCVAKEWREIV